MAVAMGILFLPFPFSGIFLVQGLPGGARGVS